MGKTRDLSRKRGIKGMLHARMGTIKDRNGKDLIEAEVIKKWQEYTEEIYKKGLNDWITTGHSRRARHSGRCKIMEGAECVW